MPEVDVEIEAEVYDRLEAIAAELNITVSKLVSDLFNQRIADLEAEGLSTRDAVERLFRETFGDPSEPTSD